MTYSIIGTGNIAWFLGKRLTIAGHECAGVYGRNEADAALLAEAIRARVFSSIEEVNNAAPNVCFIAIADGGIEEVVAKLSLTNTLLVHTAGAISIDVLQPAARDCGVLWPVYSINKTHLPGHRQIPCGWEATTEKAKRVLLTMGHAVTDVLFETDGEQRQWMHLSAVIGNNFTNHLIAICQQLCTSHNVPFAMLQPILAQTFSNISHGSPYAGQTGPARRGDAGTTQKQLHLLQAYPEWQAIYRDISASIGHMYESISEEKDTMP